MHQPRCRCSVGLLIVAAWTGILAWNRPVAAVMPDSPEVKTVLDERERRCGFALPPSLREWYGLAGAKELLDVDNFGDRSQHAVPLGQLGDRRVGEFYRRGLPTHPSIILHEANASPYLPELGGDASYPFGG